MGCIHPKERRFPGQQNPIILASETACKFISIYFNQFYSYTCILYTNFVCLHLKLYKKG
jgi:hypothetical protein